MTKQNRLHRRKNSGVYYCRVAVPEVLQSRIGKREIHVSLRTSDLCEAKVRLQLESYKIDQMLAQARGEQPRPLMFESGSFHHNVMTTPSPDSLSFTDLLDKYLDSPEKQRLSHKTRLDYVCIGRILKELIGADKPVLSITRPDCRFVQETLTKLPSNSAKRWPGKKVLEVVKIAQAEQLEPMAPKNVNKYMIYLSGVFEWATRERLMEFNPARGLQVSDSARAKDKRNPFTIDQLNRIFGSDDMQDYRRTSHARFWVPMLSLWTGARLNELCQLHTADVVKRGALHCLLIREGEGKQLKTASANRVIPLHPVLVKMGFVELVHAAQKRNGVRLFPKLHDGVRGYPSDLFGKWFTRYLRKAGAKTDKNSFHSFRHNFRDALREAGVERDVTLALGGWSTGSGASEIYGSGFSEQRLYEAVKRIEYVGLRY